MMNRIIYYLNRLKQEEFRFYLASRIFRSLVPNYYLTWPELEWFHQEDIKEVLERFEELKGFNAHRRFALQQLLRLTKNVLGDTAECGVYKGLSSYIILKQNQYSSYQRVHHIFDSFEGLSQPAQVDGTHWKKGDLACSLDIVKQNLQEFSSVVYHKGWIPEKFHEVKENTFAFVHIDVDLYEPTYCSISFFYERLNPGGILVCDDYGFLTCPGATKAIDDYLKDKQEKMVYLPGGGGFFIKDVPTN